MKKVVLNISLSGMFLALAYVMPFITGQIPEIGKMMLPMHIPVLLCGFICGAPYGLVVGATAPLLRSLTLGMPPILTAVTMTFELAAYGFMTGILYKSLPKKKINIYVSLVGAMVVGRLVEGFASYCVYQMGFDVKPLTLEVFWASTVVNAIPGIIIQIVFVPVIIMLLEKAKLMTNKK